jgi:HSP20 family protein
MDEDRVRSWMWSQACEMLNRAERLQRRFFQPASADLRSPAWEPPVDVLETQGEILVFVALPGVSVESVEVSASESELAFVAVRAAPVELRSAVIHRLELPQGRFERRLRLPPGQYGLMRHSVVNGCLLISVEKKGAS